MKQGRAIWAAYNDVDALSVTCTNCGAQKGQWCTRPDGRVRRVPCVERAAASIGSGDGRPHSRDYSEPTHPTLKGNIC
jgi:hypothetical protein